MTSNANPGVSMIRTLGSDYAFFHDVEKPGAYQFSVDARNFVKVGRRSLANITFVGEAVENVEVVMIEIVANKDIGNEFQE